MVKEYSEQEKENNFRTFRIFLARLKEEHPNELRGLGTDQLASFGFSNETPFLRIHERVKADIRIVIHAKWKELFPHL